MGSSLNIEEEVAPVAPGDLLAGKYRVERVLGAGGMGVVVAARHEQLDELVALKFLLPGAIEHGENLERFLREAKAAVRIKSEHVARVSDVGTLDNGAPYIVMEHLTGSDLADLVRARGALPCEEAVDYVLQACVALAEAHALGIVHRDLKPSNLFRTVRIDGTPLVKVLDFGIARSIRGGAGDGAANLATITSTRTVMGSPRYMAPEQVRDARAVDARADLWSLGVILYELLSAAVPFDANTSTGMLAAVLIDSPRPISEVRPDLPSGVEAVILRCLEKNPADRYADVGELARALLPFAPESRAVVERISRIAGSTAADGRGRPSEPAASTNPSVSVYDRTVSAGLLGASDDPRSAQGVSQVRPVPPPAPASVDAPEEAAPTPDPRRAAVASLALAVLANVLGAVPISGPLNIQFGLTALPVLLAAYTLGPAWGVACGLLGGIVQAQQYGHWGYLGYTAILGGVAGLLARHESLTRKVAAPLGFATGFLAALWLDLLRASRFAFADLGASFADAPRVFGPGVFFGRPAIALVAGIAMAVLGASLGRGITKRGDLRHLLLAGCAGVVAYVPYDALVLYGLQGYPWLPAWFVLAKDIVQDVLAAYLCAALAQDRRVRKLLAGV